jgi:hypothetical protein
MPPDNMLVYVIESPSSEDLLDERTEGRALTEALRLSRIKAAYSLATDRATFYRALGERLKQVLLAQPDTIPHIHISCHGDANGLQLTDGSPISWDELRQLLLPLNKALNDRLLVCMSSCFGASAARTAMWVSGDLPFFALVGHPGALAWSDGAVAYIAFYHRLGKGAHITDAVHAMKAASGDDKFQCQFGPLVQEGWREFMRTSGDEIYRRSLLQALDSQPDPPAVPPTPART